MTKADVPVVAQILKGYDKDELINLICSIDGIDELIRQVVDAKTVKCPVCDHDTEKLTRKPLFSGVTEYKCTNEKCKTVFAIYKNPDLSYAKYMQKLTIAGIYKGYKTPKAPIPLREDKDNE
jgi:transposase-like protein